MRRPRRRHHIRDLTCPGAHDFRSRTVQIGRLFGYAAVDNISGAGWRATRFPLLPRRPGAHRRHRSRLLIKQRFTASDGQGLTILDRFGIHTFEHLPVLAFAVDPLSTANPTVSYSYRLQQNYSAHADFSADIRTIRKPTRVLVGAEDDLLIADVFAPLFGAERSDISIKIIPGLGHTEMNVMPAGLSAFVEAFRE